MLLGKFPSGPQENRILCSSLRSTPDRYRNTWAGHMTLGNSGHALEVFALLTGIALFLINRLSRKRK